MSEILEHSFYVHLLGIALVVVVHVVLGESTHISHLVKRGPQSFLELYFDEAIRWYVGYSLYMIPASAAIGAYSVPTRVAAGVVAFLRAVRRLRLLRWIPEPGDMQPQEPSWHQAFRSMAETVSSTTNSEYLPPVALVRMKDSGDIYIGEIASYPIALDTQPEKDFLLVQTTYWKGGAEDPDAALDFNSVDGIGAVLLNSRDVESVRVVYRRDADVNGDDQPPEVT